MLLPFFAIIVFSRRKDWPSLYHSLGRQTYTLRHYRTDVPPDLMNREISGIFSRRISDVRDGGPVLSDKGRDTMNIMKKRRISRRLAFRVTPGRTRPSAL